LTTWFFEPDGDRFRATELTRGPWSERHQHGGPPAALLGGAMEKHVSPADVRAARFTIVFHRPIAIGVFRVTTETVREGKKVRLVRAQLIDGDDRAVATADATFVRRDHTTEVSATVSPAPPPPDTCDPFEFSFFTAPVGYHTAMEARHIEGTWGTGALSLWMRIRGSVLAGEAPSPLQRVLAAADSGNGLSVALDLARFTFVNPDLTVLLARELDGEWLGMHARTTFGPDGVGLADTKLVGRSGDIGRGLQSLIVEHR